MGARCRSLATGWEKAREGSGPDKLSFARRREGLVFGVRGSGAEIAERAEPILSCKCGAS